MSAVSKGRRVELHAISGLRVFATFFMVSARAVETLWLDNSGNTLWLSMYSCTFLRRIADDLVCFYFVLSGFTISWGYMNRDFESSAVRRRYWIGRLERFYPDFFISTSFALLIKRPSVFGCHAVDRLDWVFNLLQLALIGGWVAWLPYPNHGNMNGPSWFLVTLVWLWVLYPWLVRPVREIFRGDSLGLFTAKLVAVWLISLMPWVVLIIIRQSFGPFWGFGGVVWGVKAFPLFRLPEFIMGMALAVRLFEDPEYVEIGREDGWRRPGSILLWGCAGAVLAAVGYAVVGAALVDPVACTCLDASNTDCFGWLQLVDTRYALISAALIYALAGLDCAASAAGPGDREAQGAAALSAAGPAGQVVWSFFSWQPFQEINRWGLQIFLYQCPTQVLLQALLVDLGVGLTDRCNFQPLASNFAVFYVLSQIAATYLVAWTFHDRGPLGRPIHAAAHSLATSAIAALDEADRSAAAAAAAAPPASPPPPATIRMV